MAEQSIPYDMRELYRKLAEIQGYFAELRYIDTALPYLEQEKSSWWHNAPLGPGVDYVEAQFGTTFPFKKTYTVPMDFIRLPWQEGKKTEVLAHLQTLATEANTWAATEVEAITSRIKPYTWPVGSSYESRCIKPVQDAHRDLHDEISADFGKLRQSIGRWEGSAADSFAENFYHPFEHTLRPVHPAQPDEHRALHRRGAARPAATEPEQGRTRPAGGNQERRGDRRRGLQRLRRTRRWRQPVGDDHASSRCRSRHRRHQHPRRRLGGTEPPGFHRAGPARLYVRCRYSGRPQ